jgi:RHS repeat-associated protein
VTANGTAETLTYDALSRQVREQAPGSIDWRYLYSGAGERAARIPAGGTTQYAYRDEGNRIVTEYYGATLGRDNVFLGSQLVASFISSSQAGPCTTYPCWEWDHSDHLGTPRLVTDASHTVIDSRKYWPYGAGIPGQAGTLQKLKFCTMERDSESAHYYDHARMQDAGLSRFTSPDRLGGRPADPQSWNRYSYSRSSPLNYVDGDGQGIDLPPDRKAALEQNEETRAQVAETLERTGNGFLRGPVDFVLGLFLPSTTEFVLSAATVATPAEAAAAEFSIVDWAGYPAELPKPAGPFRVLQGDEYQEARVAADKANRALHTGDPSLAGKQIHEIHPVKFGGDPVDRANKIALTRQEHARVTTWWNRLLKRLKRDLAQK